MSRYRYIAFTLALGGLLLLGLFLLLNDAPRIAYADPGDLFVMPHGDGDCSQAAPCGLRAALDGATGGDTIYVARGTYTGTGGAVITLTKSITLYGGWDGAPAGPVARDPEAYPATLDGEGERRVIYLNGRLGPIMPTVDGFVIANGNAAHAPCNSGRGGGIHTIGTTPLIAHNVIVNNVAGPSDTDGRAYGGGIFLDSADGTVVITANQIISNVANASGHGRGGGIYLSDASGAQVMNNVVLSNTAVITGDRGGYGGGIALSSSPDVMMTGNQIVYNVAYRGPTWQSSDGGGVYCSSSHDLTFRDNVVHSNVVNLNAGGGTGGGLMLWSCYRATVAHNLLAGNVSSGQNSGSGGGLYTYAARDLTLEANRFLANRAYRGGGLYLGHNTGFTMTNNVVAENVGGCEGGGMAFEAWRSEPVTGTLLHNTFAANDGGDWNGRIAIHVNDPYVTLALTNNLIYSHTYGVYAVATSTARLDQTLFYANSDGDVGGVGDIVNVGPITGQDPLLDADYRLRYGSPAIDAGAVLPGVDVDVDGEARPNGLGYDVGADEFYFHCSTALTGVDIRGSAGGVASIPYAFTAEITPADATRPITYTWSPEPDAGQSGAFATYSWATSGTKVVTVAAENCGGGGIATHAITIAGEPRRLFLPLALSRVEGLALSMSRDKSRDPVEGLVTSERPAASTSAPGVGSGQGLCPPLDPPSGDVVEVSTVAELEAAVNSATSGTTILVADGTYNLDGVYLRFDVPNVTLRSASGDREVVVLDGNYATTEIVQIVASNVTIADLTLREAYYHPIHVMSSSSADTTGTLIYNVHVIDPGEQAIKINPYTGENALYFPDDGVIACSHIELTDAGRPHIRNNCYTGGVDAHQARDWIIRDNLIEGFWCDSGLSEHGVHLWRSCRDTLVERNELRNNARGVGFGLVTSGSGVRTYPDDPCPGAEGSYVDHYGGIIRNNVVFANRSELFASQYGFDCGICLWNACGAQAVHNTVASTQAPFSSIEWRFDNTDVEITNNLVSHNLRDRGGTGSLDGNVENAPLSSFVDGANGDLHLAEGADSAIDQGVPLAAGLCDDDFDGDPRPIGSAPDVGADEIGACHQADVDGDGDVDIDDIQAVADIWRCVEGDDCYETQCDFNHDNVIDIVDIMVVASCWGYE